MSESNAKTRNGTPTGHDRPAPGGPACGCDLPAEVARLRAENARLAETNALLERTVERLAADASPDGFVRRVQEEMAELLGGRCSAQFRLDVAAGRVAGGVIYDDGTFLPDEPGLDAPFASTPALPGVLAANGPTVFDLARDESRIQPYTVEFMRRRGYTWLVNLPLFVGGEPAWLVAVLGDDRSRLTDRSLAQFAALARQLTLALQMNALAGEAREAAVARERNRLAREIHDTLAQCLTGVSMQARAAGSLLAARPDVAAECLTRIEALAHRGLREARRSVAALEDDAAEYADLAGNLARTVDESTAGTPVVGRVEVAGNPYPVPPDVGRQLLRIAQEAVTNSLRHAAATHVVVRVAFAPGEVAVRVADGGRGFAPAAEGAAGFGLAGMRKRAERVGAALEITSGTPGGTTVAVTAPVIPWSDGETER